MTLSWFLAPAGPLDRESLLGEEAVNSPLSVLRSQVNAEEI